MKFLKYVLGTTLMLVAATLVSAATASLAGAQTPSSEVGPCEIDVPGSPCNGTPPEVGPCQDVAPEKPCFGPGDAWDVGVCAIDIPSPCNGPWTFFTDGDIAVHNRSGKDKAKTVLVVIRDPYGKRVAREKVTLHMPSRSVAELDPAQFLTGDDLQPGYYSYVVRNVRRNGKIGRRNYRGTVYGTWNYPPGEELPYEELPYY